MCSDIASASSLEFCELCPEVRSTLADYCGFSKEQRAAWRDDVWEKAATKKVHKKYASVVELEQVLPDWKGRGVQVLKWNASLHLGDNPQLFFDMLDNMELRTKWDKNMESMEHSDMLPALDGRAKVHVSVTHTKSAMKGLVSPREFCSCILEIREKDFLANAAHGLGRRLPSKYPPLSSHVRGAMHFWGCMLKRNPSRDGVWDMTMCMQVSVNGWVPSGPVMSETMKLQKRFFVFANEYAQDSSTVYNDDGDDIE